jgi:hypothetical protein
MTEEFESYPDGLYAAHTRGLKHADGLECLAGQSQELAEANVFGSDPLGMIVAELYSNRMGTLVERMRALPGHYQNHWETYRVMADNHTATEKNLSEYVARRSSGGA